MANTYTITNGSTTQGELFSKDIAGQMVNILEAIRHGNSPILQMENPINAYLDPVIKKVPAVLGQRVPVETYNIRWTEGGIMSDAPEFNTNRAHFTLKKQSFKVLAYKHDFEDIREAESSGVDLLAGDLEKTIRIRNNYMNTFLPTLKIQTLISGDSSSTSLPVLNVGGAYTSNLGVLRGENCADILQPYVMDKNVNMLRAKKGTVLSATDIFDMVQRLKGFTTNAGCVIEALASSRSIWELQEVLNDTKNKDTFLEDGVPKQKIATLSFVTIDSLPDGYIFFIAKTNDPIIYQAVNPNEKDQGLLLVSTQGISHIKDASGIDGAYLEIAKTGYHLLKRESVGILDITNADGSGLMTSTGVTGLETFLATVRNGIVQDY